MSTTSLNGNGWDDADNEEAVEDHIVASCPSRGRCPFCRMLINMFDLKSSQSQPLYNQNTDLEKTPLNGLEFVEKIVNRTISFKDGTAEVAIYRDDINGDDSDDSKELVRKQRFDQGYHFHAKSSTFSGVVDWTKVSSNIYLCLKIFNRSLSS